MTNIAVFLILIVSWTAIAAADEFGSGANMFDIEFVTTGNPGNPVDTTGAPSPAGSVPYNYRMGRFEISRGMIEKANAEGELGITLIDLSSFGGNGPNRPATGVSWNEAARFVNWLNTSTGHAAAYKFEFQPGEAGYDANANIQLWDPGDAGYDADNLFRNSQAKYWLPSYDEWYKAAYYDPTSGTYFDYPTGSDTAPTPVASGTTAGTAVYDQPFLQGPADVSLAGGLSPYGTMGQGGNVIEWEESESDLVNDSSSAPRSGRGGSWSFGSSNLQSSVQGSGPPTVEQGDLGFRVASSLPPSDTFGSGVNQFDIEFVTTGNPGNPDDTTGAPSPAGSVPYNYRMGRFEISRGMIEEANAEGELGITLIDLSSFGGNGPNRPATGVSWNEAARFVNWLNTSTGHAAAYKFEFQPGEAGYDANANIQLWDPGDAGYDPNNLFRNSQAKYWLPSYDEWYKAAYYDPTSGTYFDYPTGSDTAPTPVASGTTAGTAVYDQPFLQGPADVSLAGGLSPYGTMGQGGNVIEWEESESDLVNDSSSAPRSGRGGSWSFGSSNLQSSVQGSGPPTVEQGDLGFRVASSLVLGDANGDGVVDFVDVSPFLLALFNRPQYEIDFPGIDADVVLDINGDGVLDFVDVTPFLDILFP